MMDGYWRDDAACLAHDPRIWFPTVPGNSRAARRAKEICAGCQVRADCLAYAIGNHEHYGIWGGLSEEERKAMTPARRRARSR